MISYLQIENLSKSYGDFVMFENLSFQLGKDQKIALIARNGTGKTTLFNILCGKDSPDKGSVTFLKDISIGFLEQDPPYDKNKTVIEQVMTSPSSVVHVIEEYEKALLSTDKNRLQKAMELMEIHQAWDFETRITQILGKLKIHDLDKPMGTLSGGQRKRVALANALINNPDLLILDEPTNHLDLEMIEWLEEYLTGGTFALLMVTHDRYFLDRVCNEILELDNKKLYQYDGNYSYYIEKRAERIENENTNVDKAKNLMRKELEWIRRMPKARGTKAKYRVDAFDDLKEKASAGRTEKKVNINIQSSRLGSKIIEIEHLNKSFGDLKIVNNFSYKFARMEKVGIVGINGSGKSTFLNLITTVLKPDSGSIEIGETITFGYYRQDGLSFDENMRVIDVATSIAEVVSLGDGNKMGVSQFLNYFLFPPEVQYSYVYKLSGGEKRRLYLMTVLMQNPNFLILDEPTNDLDILTLNVLEDYLQNFAGCVIIVSHDRYFMDKLVDHIFVFEGNGVIKDFPGNYTDYRDYSLQKEKEQRSAERVERKPSETNNKPVKSTAKKMSFKEQREFELLSAEIELMEKEKKKLEMEISTGNLKSDDLIQKSNRIGELINLIDQKSERWLELGEL
jgi:ABC transport system ATP-binding/permease protein